MNEALFQFIWQYSLYNPTQLKSTTGETITIIHPGRRNTNAGPDFEEARVRIGNTTLVGNVELHVNSSDWKKHGHDTDPAYQNIILHVVYFDDEVDDQHNFPTLQLSRQIPPYIIDQYTNLIQTTQPIACAKQLGKVNELVKESWLNRLLAERWEQKLNEWKELLEQSKGDWRNLLYWRMAANFGFKVNTTPFLMLARSIPLNVLARHKENLVQIEALLFGQAGMLEEKFEEDYPALLQKEYQYLKKKYSLEAIPSHLWKFLRLRPANFPTIRIAQFAALIHRSFHLFSKIIESLSIKEIHSLLEVHASEYWSAHFRFGEAQKKATIKYLGRNSIDNIIINTIAPIQFLFAHYHGNIDQQERALQLLSGVDAEHNKFIAHWEQNGWKPMNAAESQSLLQLFHNYCEPKRCLECAIGLNIVKHKQDVLSCYQPIPNFDKTASDFTL